LLNLDYSLLKVLFERQAEAEGRAFAFFTLHPDFASMSLNDMLGNGPVSYTHLTLPTSDLV